MGTWWSTNVGSGTLSIEKVFTNGPRNNGPPMLLQKDFTVGESKVTIFFLSLLTSVVRLTRYC